MDALWLKAIVAALVWFLRDQNVGAEGWWGSKIYRMGWGGSTVVEDNKFFISG